MNNGVMLSTITAGEWQFIPPIQLVASTHTPGEIINVAIDIDGVLADFIHHFYNICNEIWPGIISPDYVQPDWALSNVLSPSQMTQAWEFAHENVNLWDGLKPLQGMYDLRRSFITTDLLNRANIYYVTQRMDPANGAVSALESTNMWLSKMGLRFHPTTTVIVQSSSDKAKLYKLLNVKYSLDDKPETVRESLSVPGHSAYLLDQSWNRSADWMLDLPRVYDVNEFVRLVLE